jgi:hypothetical protein
MSSRIAGIGGYLYPGRFDGKAPVRFALCQQLWLLCIQKFHLGKAAADQPGLHRLSLQHSQLCAGGFPKLLLPIEI